MITTASKGWSGALRLTLFALATIVLLSISAIISCIFPYFLPKSACIEEYSKACRIAKTGDPTALMLSAWHKAQDEKQPVRDRTRIMYNVVDWLCRNDKTAEVKDLFAPTEKILQANKMSDELACVLTDHAGALAETANSSMRPFPL